ncbi:MAG: diacylglycerol kinase family protein [Myxococcota bacterium]
MTKKLPIAAYTIPNDRYAVVLNANAGRVTERLIRDVKGAIDDPQRLHLTQSPEHADVVLRRCVRDGIRTIFAGGGDGTIVGILNSLHQIRSPIRPTVGILRLGTGNALANWIGSGDPLTDLLRWQGKLTHKIIPMAMIEAEGASFPFAGAGIDAAILNDYNALKARAKDRWWSPLVNGIAGYLLAGYLKTLPNTLRRPKVGVEIINLDSEAERLGPDGIPVGPPIRPGQVLYKGTAAMVGAATTPLYGYKMRMFPFATQHLGRFQLRVIDTAPLQSALNILPAWRGTLNHPQVHDFAARRVRVRFSDAMPVQFAGEACGFRQEVVLTLNAKPAHLVACA